MENAINAKRGGVTEPLEKSVIAITGATGFIGRRLIDALLKREDVLIHALARSPDHLLRPHPRLTVIAGDLARINTLSDLLVPGCTVINLAYDFASTHAENMRSTENLIRICKDHRAKRLIHCSTASVFGRAQQDVLNEESACSPLSEYAVTKLAIERLFLEGARGNFEYINLRPTSVFGPGGSALKKLVRNLGSRSAIVNYLKSCLFNRRKLNLVSVDTVVAAILFVLDRGRDVAGQTFIISEDDDPNNNFEHVERYLFREIYGKRYALRPIRVPLVMLAIILRIMGRDNTNPHRTFDSGKLRKLGFLAPRPLESSLDDLVRWEAGRSDQGGTRNSSVSSEH